MSKENEQVFKHCDSFVVLSSDEQKKQDWLKFGQDLSLECVGCLDSSLEGKEEIFTRTPFFQGKIVGLERGTILENSSVIKAMVSDIVKKSRYGEKITEEIENTNNVMIDDTELGFELGYGKEIITEDGTPIKKVRWTENSISQIYKAINEKVNPNQPVKINGIRANFVLCGICKVLKSKGAKDIRVYDIRTKSYIPIRDLLQKRGLKQTEGLSYNVIENKQNAFLDVDITKEQYTLEDYKRCILPKIKEEKNLYLSGRMPLWLLASISNSYNSNRIFTFQPGKGFTCVSSKDEKDLGKIVDGIDGIDINKYFEDKKDRNKEKLLAIIEKQGILSKIKDWLSHQSEKKENSKYLDNTIHSNTVAQSTAPNTNLLKQNSLQEQLSKDIYKETPDKNQSKKIPYI